MTQSYEDMLRGERFGISEGETITSAEIRELPPVRNLQQLQLPSHAGVVYKGLRRLSAEEHLRRARIAYEFITGN